MNRRAALATSAVLTVTVLGGGVAAAAVSGIGLLGFRRAGNPATGAVASAPEPALSTTVVTTIAPETTRTSTVVRVIEDRIVIASQATTAVAPLDAAAIGSGRDVAVAGRASGANAATPPPAPVPSTSVVRSREDTYEHEHEHDDEHDDEHEDGEGD